MDVPIAIRSAPSWQGRLAFVPARAGETDIALLLDTGANAAFVTSAVAAAAELAAVPWNRPAEDFAAAEANVHALAPGSLAVGGRPLDPAFAVDSPVLDAAGIFGAFHPARLGRADETVVVDLPAGRLAVLPRHHAPTPRGAVRLRPTCPVEDPREAPRWTVRARVGGRPVRLLVDTGFARTTVDADSAAGRHLARTAATTGEPYTIAGVAGYYAATPIPDVDVVLAGGRVTTTVGLASAGSLAAECGAHGIVGLDVLRHCRLSVGPARAAISCRP